MSTGMVVAKKRGPKPKPGEQREFVITIRCRGEYRDWLNEFARKERLTPTQLIDFGLIELAKLKKNPLPPDR